MEEAYSIITEYGGKLGSLSRSLKEKSRDTNKAIEERIYKAYPNAANLGFALREAVYNGDLENIKYLLLTYTGFIPVSYNGLVSVMINSPNAKAKDVRIAKLLIDKTNGEYQKYLQSMIEASKMEGFLTTTSISLEKIGKLDLLLNVPREFKLIVDRILELFSDMYDAIIRSPISKYDSFYNAEYAINWLIQHGYMKDPLVLSIVNDDVEGYNKYKDSIAAEDNIFRLILIFDAINIYDQGDFRYNDAIYARDRILKQAVNIDPRHLIYELKNNDVSIDKVSILDAIMSHNKNQNDKDYALYRISVDEEYPELVDKYMTPENALQIVSYSGIDINIYRILNRRGFDAKGIAYVLDGPSLPKAPPKDKNLWKHLLATSIKYVATDNDLIYHDVMKTAKYLVTKYRNSITPSMIKQMVGMMRKTLKDILKGYGEDAVINYIERIMQNLGFDIKEYQQYL